MKTLVRSGILFCLIGPAGSGKSTIAQKLLTEFQGLSLSVSVTSRTPRPGEVDGIHYHFVSREEFESRQKNGDFFEWEETHGNYYGTLRSTLTDAVHSSRDLLLDIDIRGAVTFKKAYPENTLITFLLPPSMEELVNRMRGRGTVSEADLQVRLNTAKEEYRLLFEDLGGSRTVDHIVINDSLDVSYSQVKSILVAGRTASPRVALDALRKQFLV